LDQLEEPRYWIAFDVEFCGSRRFDQFSEFADVRGSRVSAIWPRMNGDSAGSLRKTNCCGLHHAGSGSAPSVTQQRDFVEVDAEHGHVIHPKRRLTFRISRALPTHLQ
jgi:hypothetical protein